jgi:hypothetical protein
MPRIRTMPALLTLLALAATSASRATRAEDCLAGPNAQSPQGSHWYYRIDRATHRKCWYLGAQHAQHRRTAARGESTPAARDEDAAAREVPSAAVSSASPPQKSEEGIVAAPPDPGFGPRWVEKPPRASADAAPDSPAPASGAPTALPPPERIAPRAVATTTERVRPPAPAKPPETAQPAAAAAVPTPASEAHGALPAALFGVALLLASVGTMLVRARRRMIRVQHAAPSTRRTRRTLSDILAQAERGEPNRADAATSFFERLGRGLDENGVRTAADEEPLLVPPRAANVPDIAAATLQPAIEEIPPEPPGSKSPGVEPAPDVEQSLRQLLADWERRAA